MSSSLHFEKISSRISLYYQYTVRAHIVFSSLTQIVVILTHAGRVIHSTGFWLEPHFLNTLQNHQLDWHKNVWEQRVLTSNKSSSPYSHYIKKKIYFLVYPGVYTTILTPDYFLVVLSLFSWRGQNTRLAAESYHYKAFTRILLAITVLWTIQEYQCSKCDCPLYKECKYMYCE